MLLWYFWIYSFLGYLLEKVFAWSTRAEFQGRKCFVALPLCPVYGLGMLAVLALPQSWQTGWRLVLAGGLAATAVEYAVHWGYERFLHVRFWDYSRVWGNLCGRVCLPFAAVWGLLVVPVIIWVQPVVETLAVLVPPEVTFLCLLAFSADAVCSAWLLRKAGHPEILQANVM